MTTYATAITTTANAVTAALATAVSTAQTLRANLAAGTGGQFVAGATLVGIANNAGGKMGIGEMRRLLDTAIADLSAANQEFVTIAALLGSIGTLD